MNSQKIKKGQAIKKKNINKKNINKKIENKGKSKKSIKKNNILKNIFKILLLVIIVAGIISFMLISPIFNIKNIEVINNKKISQETIVSLSNISTGQNIFEFNKKEVIINIKQNAYVEDVKISRNMPDTIKIKIVERMPKYSIEIVGKYAYIDIQGNILEISDNPNNMIILKGVETEESNILPNNRLNQNDLKKLEDVLKITNSAKQNNIEEKITSIDISDNKNYKISINSENKEIYFGDCTNVQEKMIYTIAILEQEKGKSGEIYVNGNFNEGFNAYFREKL